MDQRIALVNSIKKLDMDELTMLGVTMNSKEYKEIDNEGKQAENNDDQNGTLIELNVNELSLKRI